MSVDSPNYPEIRTPLLRWLSTFYGHLGVQLRVVSLSSPGSLLNAALNVFLIGLMHYSLLFLDCFPLQVVSNRVPTGEKPIFRLLVDFCFTYGFPLFSLTKLTFYLAMGRRIVRLLDAPPFWTTYQQKMARGGSGRRREVLTFLLILALNLANFAFGYVNAIIAFAISPVKDGVEVLKLLANFLSSMLAFLEFQVLHYYQWATMHSLLAVERTLKRSALPVVESKALQRVKCLANLHSDLCSLMSLPFLILIVMIIVNTIVIVCVIIFIEEDVQLQAAVFAFYTVLVGLYALKVVHLNEAAQRCFQRICERLRQRHAPATAVSLLQPVFSSSDGKDRRTPLTPQFHHHHSSLAGGKGCMIRLYELSQYRKHFQLRLFRLTLIDLSVLFSLVLLTLGHVIFLVQTK